MFFFHYDLVTANYCLSDTLEKAKCGTNSSLQSIFKDNLNKLIFSHLNINSIRNKFDILADIIKDKIDILMISESKVDNSFPDGQFFLDGFGTPLGLDGNRNSGSRRWLLVKDGSVSIHHQNLQKLAAEMLKVFRGLSHEIANALFQFREQIPYELRQRPQFQIP